VRTDLCVIVNINAAVGTRDRILFFTIEFVERFIAAVEFVSVTATLITASHGRSGGCLIDTYSSILPLDKKYFNIERRTD
jgi:hypothetical protein